MLVTSRSLAEYRAMFGLAPHELELSIVDCCAGGASFAAETHPGVVAVDPAYALGRKEVADLVRAALHGGDRIIDENPDRFEWDWYGSPADRMRMRIAAAEAFLADLDRRPSRYLAAALPWLPLASRSFDLVLCSHLLFTWSDRFDEDWHHSALAELIRVSRGQVRVFPLVVQATAEPVSYLDSLRAEIEGAGHHTELRDVSYRFQRGASQMLVITTQAGKELPRPPGRPRPTTRTTDR